MNRKIYLGQIYNRVSQGLISVRKLDNLVIFNYTNKCHYKSKWDYWTKLCRGLIVNLDNSEIVALPFSKFFNLNENFETTMSMVYNKFINEPVEITGKIDGSLGILFPYKSEFRIATRGSFDSEQAIWATNFFQKNYKIDDLLNYEQKKFLNENTLLFEIVYKENRNVVEYKTENLVLIGCKNINTGYDFSYNELKLVIKNLGLPFLLFKHHNFSFDGLLSLQKESSGIEGYVLRFNDGYRVKIKTDEYVKLARFINRLSSLVVWENMENGKVKKEFIDKIPDDLKPKVLEITSKLEIQYIKIKEYVDKIYFKTDKELTRKKVAEKFIFYPKVIQGMLFSRLDLRYDQIETQIMKVIKPVGNNFVNVVDAIEVSK